MPENLGVWLPAARPDITIWQKNLAGQYINAQRPRYYECGFPGMIAI